MKHFEAITSACRRQAARLRTDESGATAVEYALVASGVAVAVAATVFTLGSSVQNMFTTLAGLFP